MPPDDGNTIAPDTGEVAFSEKDAVAALVKMRGKTGTDTAPPSPTPTPHLPAQQQADQNENIDTANEATEFDLDIGVDEDEVSSGDESEETSKDGEFDPNAVIGQYQGQDITAAEALKGYMRQDDYTRKTEATSNVQKIASERVAVTDRVAEFYNLNLPRLVEGLQRLIPAEPDQSLRQTEPHKFWDQYNARQAALQELAQWEQTQVALKQSRAQQAELSAQEKFVEESVKLLEALPSWKNPKIAARERKAISEYGLAKGFTKAELAQADHRSVVVLRDAVLGAKVRAAGGKVTPKPKADPNPTVSVRQTAGIRATPATNGAAAASPQKLSINPDANRRVQMAQGAAMLARRSRPK